METKIKEIFEAELKAQGLQDKAIMEFEFAKDRVRSEHTVPVNYVRLTPSQEGMIIDLGYNYCTVHLYMDATEKVIKEQAMKLCSDFKKEVRRITPVDTFLKKFPNVIGMWESKVTVKVAVEGTKYTTEYRKCHLEMNNYQGGSEITLRKRKTKSSIPLELVSTITYNRVYEVVEIILSFK